MEDESTFEPPAEHSQLPSIHIDYRAFAVDIYGGRHDTLDDVERVAERRIQQAVDDIVELKENDYELADEFEQPEEEDDGGHNPGSHYQ